jgi:hypothetical protein
MFAVAEKFLLVLFLEPTAPQARKSLPTAVSSSL